MPPKKKAEPRKGKTIEKHNAKMHKLVKPKKQAKPKTETAPKKIASKQAQTGSTINFYIGGGQSGNRNITYDEFKNGMHRPNETAQSRNNAQRRQLPEGYVLVERAPATRTATATPPAFSNTRIANVINRDLNRLPTIEDVDDDTPRRTHTRNTNTINRILNRAPIIEDVDDVTPRRTHATPESNNTTMRVRAASTGDILRFVDEVTEHSNTRDYISRFDTNDILRFADYEAQMPTNTAGRAAVERAAGMRPIGNPNPIEGRGIVNNPARPPLSGIHTFADSVDIRTVRS